jgi:ABC-type transport system involved in multi-copper enzyme maturation permease subunit
MDRHGTDPVLRCLQQNFCGILIVFNLLAGLALSSFSILGGSFFKKAQLSGISTTIISLLLAVLAQVIGKPIQGRSLY